VQHGNLHFLPGLGLAEANFEMPLHRDIFWVGRQWLSPATECRRSIKAEWHVRYEVSGLWEDGLVERHVWVKWINILDFDNGLAARASVTGTTAKSRAA